MRNYAQIIRALRTDHDMSQTQLAELLGTTKNQLGKYERGEQEIPVRHIISLSNIFHVSADYILGLPQGRPYGTSKTQLKKE